MFGVYGDNFARASFQAKKPLRCFPSHYIAQVRITLRKAKVWVKSATNELRYFATGISPQIPLKEVYCVGNGFCRDRALSWSPCAWQPTLLSLYIHMDLEPKRATEPEQRNSFSGFCVSAGTHICRPCRKTLQKALRALLGPCSLQQVLKRKKQPKPSDTRNICLGPVSAFRQERRD